MREEERSDGSQVAGHETTRSGALVLLMRAHLRRSDFAVAVRWSEHRCDPGDGVAALLTDSDCSALAAPRRTWPAVLGLRAVTAQCNFH